MLSTGQQCWLLVLPHPQHVASPVQTIHQARGIIRQKLQNISVIVNTKKVDDMLCVI